MTEIQSLHHHQQPTFNILTLKDQGSIPDDGLQIRFKKFQYEIEIRLIGKDVEERNDIWMIQFSEEFDLADGGHVEAIFELTYFDLLRSKRGEGGDLGELRIRGEVGEE